MLNGQFRLSSKFFAFTNPVRYATGVYFDKRVTSLGGDRLDEYDDAHIKFQIITPDGSHINPEKEKQLKKYYVTAQSVKPNKIMKVTYEKRKKKSNYYHVKTQSIETIKLKVKKVGS